MRISGHRVLLCNCEATMRVDAKRIAKALGAGEEADVCTHLCRTEVERFAQALKEPGKLAVACTQEAPLFRELAAEAGRGGDVRFVNIRERAGWSADKADPAARMAALIAEGVLEGEPAGTMTVTSDGSCLVYGAGQAALETARRLQARLQVSLLLSDAGDVIAPSVVDVPIYRGRIVKASGHFGQFDVTVDGYAPAMPSSRDELGFVMARNGAKSRCAIILDLSGLEPLFPAHGRRDGYVKVDPGDAVGLAEALFEVSDLAGEFEKPLYVRYDGSICAHGRSGKTGCTRCLDACPAAAIVPDGDRVAIDPVICGGCGSCAAVCPTGAAAYALPTRAGLIERIGLLVRTFMAAGGPAPVLLVHDETHGAEMIAMMARFGRGLPGHVLALGVNQVTQAGHEVFASALAAGAARIDILCNPAKADELAPSAGEAELMNAILAGLGVEAAERVHLMVETDPDGLEARLWDDAAPAGLKPQRFEPRGSKRDVARTALGLLKAASGSKAEVIALPAGAPYGRITVDAAACTLCLACVGACPTGAIMDNPDKPQLRFVEAACVQCGLCRNTCPESAISLETRYDFTPSALSPVLLNEQEPFSCISCGKPFGTRASVEKVVEKLAGKHAMFQSQEAQNLIRMCDDCRIKAQSETADGPFAARPRPRMRTTADYLKAEAEAKAAGTPVLDIDDFLMDD
jgi:ferredoxin